MNIVYWFNQSTSDVSPAEFGRIVAALNAQAIHVYKAWGPTALQIHLVGGDPATMRLPAWAMKAYLLPNLDVAEALGYHDVDPQGDPYVRVGTDIVLSHGGTVLDGAMSISVVASHEACELAVDWTCSKWALTADTGVHVAVEVADPVQSQAYNVTLADGTVVAVSNFVRPQWFEQGATGPFDWLGALADPFAMASGGYTILQDPSGEREVFGSEFPDWKRDLLLWPASRTARRRDNARR